MGRFKGAMGKPLPPPHFQLKFCIQKAENYKNPLEAFYLMKKKNICKYQNFSTNPNRRIHF